MRMINNSVFVLIAGILSSTMVAAHYNPGQKGLLQSILEIASAPKSGNFNFSDGQKESIDNLLKESCMKNGGFRAYNTAKKGWQNFVSCTEEVNSKKIEEIQTDTAENLINSLKNYCVMASMAENCIKQLTNSIMPCMKPEKQPNFRGDSIDMIILLSFNFICEDDGARINKFIADGGQKCINSNEKAMRDCSAEFHSQYSPATEETTLFMPHRDANNCINIEKFQLCWVKVLNNCEHHSPADIVDALFNFIKKQLNCKTFYTSDASKLSVFNIVVITIVMAIFSHF